MLTRVQIKNINAIDYCDIDFQKGKYKYLENMIYQDKLVNPVAFYGTNGSGKSSFLEAIVSMISLMFSEPKNFSSFIPNHLNIKNHFETLSKEWQKEPTEEIVHKSVEQIKSSIKIFFEIADTLYEYFIETSLSGYIAKEFLNANGKLIFERNKTTYYYDDKTVEISESLYPTLRRLSMDHQEDEFVIQAFEFLSNIGYIDATKHTCILKSGIEKDYRDLIVEKSSIVKNILAEYKEFPLYNFISQPNNDGKKDYFVQLDVGNDSLTMPYQYMSSGMLNQSVLLSTLLCLPSNSALFVDEIEDALHPLTIVDFIQVAQKRNIQLIFSSHNTYLLQKLRPDQIFFANWKNGYSTYKKLSDIYPNIREVNNIEKMYFSNMFDEDIKNG